MLVNFPHADALCRAPVPVLSCVHMGAWLGPGMAQPGGSDACIPVASVYENHFHCTVFVPVCDSKIWPEMVV